MSPRWWSRSPLFPIQINDNCIRELKWPRESPGVLIRNFSNIMEPKDLSRASHKPWKIVFIFCLHHSIPRLALARARRASHAEKEGVNVEFPQPLLTVGRSCFAFTPPRSAKLRLTDMPKNKERRRKESATHALSA